MVKQTNTRNAFTLIELLVVIVIISVLAAVMASKYGKVRENGWATACKGNLRSLYQGALNYANDNGGTFPYAGPWESFDQASGLYSERKGWVNWIATSSPPTWPNSSPQAGNMTQPIWFGNTARSSITNGALWDYVSHDANVYLCPKFRSVIQGLYASSDKRYDAVRSYVMNSYFGCSAVQGSVNLTTISQEASRTLMFADMAYQVNYPGGKTVIPVCSQYAGIMGNNSPGNGTSYPGDDGVLTPTPVVSAQQSYESIGYIHNLSGEFRGHAVFLDGHVATVSLYYNDAGASLSGAPTNRTCDACTGQY